MDIMDGAMFPGKDRTCRGDPDRGPADRDGSGRPIRHLFFGWGDCGFAGIRERTDTYSPHWPHAP